MADRSTGPVKPPVIDLTARTSARADSESRSEAASSPHQESAHRPATALPNLDWRLLGGVAAGGAGARTLLTYLLGTVLPLPSHQQPIPPDLTAFVNTQGEQITT